MSTLPTTSTRTRRSILMAAAGGAATVAATVTASPLVTSATNGGNVTDTANDTFTIHMSSKRTSLTHVAWLLLG